MTDPKSIQLNVRVEGHVEQAIDAKRIALSSELRYIPSRSEIIRFALESYLGLKSGGERQGAAPVAVKPVPPGSGAAKGRRGKS